MPTIRETIQLLRDQGDFKRLAVDMMAQFGKENSPYLLAELLPEVLKFENAYSEMQIRYQTLLANAGSSYSPAQAGGGGRILGEFKVAFGHTNLFDNLTAHEWDQILKLLAMGDNGGGDNATLAAMAKILQFVANILESHMALNELYRSQALIDSQVKRRGSNGYAEDVAYPNPSGHRVNLASGTIATPTGWFGTVTAYDPFNDLFAAQRFLARKGYVIDKIVSNFTIAHQFAQHPSVRDRVGGVTLISAGGGVTRPSGSVSMDKLDMELQANRLPPWTIYDKTYNFASTTSTKPSGVEVGQYLLRGTAAAPIHPVLLVCRTGRDESLIDFGDRSSLPNGGLTLQNTLGYYGIGRVAGEAAPGRKLFEETIDKHPVGMYAEMLQEGLPVITEPEAIYVLNVAAPV
jgi:hypothetical protein